MFLKLINLFFQILANFFDTIRNLFATALDCICPGCYLRQSGCVTTYLRNCRFEFFKVRFRLCRRTNLTNRQREQPRRRISAKYQWKDHPDSTPRRRRCRTA